MTELEIGERGALDLHLGRIGVRVVVALPVFSGEVDHSCRGSGVQLREALEGNEALDEPGVLKFAVADVDVGSTVVAKNHQVIRMVVVDVLGEVLENHVVVLNVDERLVVFVEVLERAVLQIERRVLRRIQADSAREVVQIEEHGVPLVVDA